MINRLADLKKREVININDGSRLGYVSDVEIGPNGSICAIIVPGPSRMFGFMGSKDDIVIPYEKIKTMGNDIILVEIENTFYSKPKRRGFFDY